MPLKTWVSYVIVMMSLAFLLSNASKARATSYESTQDGSNHLFTPATTTGQSSFLVRVGLNRRTTQWYVNGVFKETDESTLSNGYSNPGFSYNFPVGTTTIQADVYSGNTFLNLHKWTVTATAPNRAPSLPGNISAPNVTQTTAKISWEASSDPDNDLITYTIEYGKNNFFGWTSGGTSTSTSKDLAGLTPGTEYVVRIKASDGKGGESDWKRNASDPTFTTLPSNRPPTRPGQPTAVSGTVTANGATISWGASSDPDGNPITYEAYYATTSIEPVVIADGNPITYEAYYARAFSRDDWTSAGTTSSTSKAINGLLSDQNYSLNVIARDGKGGESSNSNTSAFSTLPSNRPPTRPGQPTAVSGTVTANGATISWGASSDPDGNPITYEVFYASAFFGDWTSAGTTSSTSKAINGLLSNQNYSLNVIARDGKGGEDSNSNTSAFSTLPSNRPPTSPGQPTAVSGTVTANGATISWGASSDPDGNPITYEVFYRAFLGDWTSAGTTSSTSKAINGLLSNQNYSLKVIARDGKGGEDSNSNTSAFSTLPSNRPPTSPGQPTAVSGTVTANGATISWGASSDPDGNPITYEVYVGKTDLIGDGWTSKGQTNKLSLDLTGLQVNTRYGVRVVARDGRGGESSPQDVNPLFRTLSTLNISSITPSTLVTKDWGESVVFSITVKDGNGIPVWGASIGGDDDLQLICYTTEPNTTDIFGQINYTNTVPNGKSNGIYNITFTAVKPGYELSVPTTRQVRVNHATGPTGLTVITHGYQLSGSSWPMDMANEIRAKRGGGKVIHLDFDTGKVDLTTELAATGETIIVLNWANKSDNFSFSSHSAEPGWREAAGDLLANFLLGSGLAGEANSAGIPIHFIGHSFGTVVNSEAIRRLGLYDIQVDQMTTLDPHDQDQDWILDATNDPKVVVWHNVHFADNYWQDNAGSQTNPKDNNAIPLIDLPVGHPIESAANRDLTYETGFTEDREVASHPHSRVHEWYFRTILGNDEPDGTTETTLMAIRNWYRGQLATVQGFALTDLHRSIPPIDIDYAGLGMIAPSVMRSDSKNNPPESVFNGGFRFFEADTGTRNLPGYQDDFFSGAHDPQVKLYNDETYLHVAVLNDSERGKSFTHRPVYFPPNATYFVFEYNVQKPDAGDYLTFSGPFGFGLFWILDLSNILPGWQTINLPIPPGLKGQWGEFTFLLDNPGLGFIDAEVLIDNMSILTSAPPDLLPPTARLNAPNITETGGKTYTFTVTYVDNFSVKASTFDNNDIQVTGPNGFERLATFVSSAPTGDGSPRKVTYQIEAPGGSWDRTDTGSYSISLVAGEVSDIGNHFIPGGSIGTFQVNVADTSPPTIEIMGPTAGSILRDARNIIITASAIDNVGVTKVEFWDGDRLAKTDITPPYSCEWPITIAENGTHKWSAIAFDASGHSTSTTATFIVGIEPQPPETVTTPTIIPNGGNFADSVQVSLACSTPGAMIRYTIDGSIPSENSMTYASPFSLTASATVRVRAYKTGYTVSAVTSATFTVTPTPPNTVATPTVSPNGGTFADAVQITLSCPTLGTVIRYSIDGGIPSEDSIAYVSPFTLTASAMVRARAYKSGYTESAVSSAEFVIAPTPSTTVATPTISPQGGTFPGPTQITLSCTTPNSTIRFTMDGSEPTQMSPTYSFPITLTGSIVLKARAFKEGYIDSGVSSADFTVNPIGYTVTVTASPTHGRVLKQPDFQSYSLNSELKLTAIPSPGYAFVGWGGDAGGNDNPITLVMNGDKSITARFEAIASNSGISFVSGANGYLNTGGTSKSFAFEVTGTNTLLVVGWGHDDNGKVVSVLFDGKPLTSLGVQAFDTFRTVNFNVGMFYLLNPSPGTHELVLTRDMATSTMDYSVGLYSGVKQTGQPESSVVGRINATQTPRATLSTVSPNGWVIGAVYQDHSILSAGENTFMRIKSPDQTAVFDSNTGLTVGSHQLSWNLTEPSGSGWIFASFAPSEEPVASKPTISPLGGAFNNNVSVTIASATPGSTIRYTLDGTTPSETSLLYNGSIAVYSSSIVRAIAFAPGYKPSQLAEAVFTITPYYTITIPPTIGGRVSQSPQAASYASGTMVTLQAIADADFIFKGWGDEAGIQNPTKTVIVNKDLALSAVFVPEHSNADLRLIARYPFDGDAKEVTGNAPEGINYGAVPDADRNGKAASALRFTGTSNWVKLGIGASHFTNDFTIALWLKLEDFQAEYPAIINGDTGFIRLEAAGPLYTGEGNYRKIKFYQLGQSQVWTGNTFEPGQWYHLGMVRSGNSYRMYVNGTLSGENTMPPVSVLGDYLQVGNDALNTFGGAFFHGSMDDLRIYNKALSSTDMQQIVAIDPPIRHISSIHLAAGKLQCILQGKVGTEIAIESSNDLKSWAPLSTHVIPQGGFINVTLVAEIGQQPGAKYFRARPASLPLIPYSDDFNRPDSDSVGNGWLNFPVNVAHPLVIKNGKVTVDESETGDGGAAIYHPMPVPALPVVLSVTFTDKNGYGWLRNRYQSGVAVLYDPQTGKGYGLSLTHADQWYNDSRVTIFDGDTTVASFNCSFQFGDQITVSATFREDGSIEGSISGSGTFSFSVPARTILSSGTNVMLGINRSANGSPTILPTVDTVSLTRP